MSANIFQKINELLEKGKRFAVATIVRSEGSSPRGVGAKMIVLEDGRAFGTIGGDLAEAEVKEEAFKALESGEPRTVKMKLEEEEKGGVGMKCGGEIEVSIEVPQPPPKLVLIGGGRVAVAVAELAKEVGFEIEIVDPFAEKSGFPDSARVVSKPVKEGLAEINVTPQSYIVIITRHKYDEPALKESLKTDAGYIGLMGSENRVNSVFEKLEKEGIDRKDLSRVNAPVGLDIGAETPKEIAVSIIGELIKKRRSPESTGESLKIDY